MSDEERASLADRAIALAARAMNALGLNGTRLLWKWSQRRQALGESEMRREILWRSARGRHKMCPSCRALVPRGARSCPECKASLAGVRAPGMGRLLSNLLPGATTASSLLLLVNSVMFALMALSPAPDGGSSFGRLISFDGFTLARFGGGLGYLVLHHGEWWRLVTSLFLHGGLLHFAFNTYVLVQLGPQVEETYGTERFWALYLWAGLCGNLAAQFLRPEVPVVGASGSIVGLAGVLLGYGIRRGGLVGGAIRKSMTQYAIYILIFSLLPGISLLSHAGGFVGGLVASLAIPAGALRSRTALVAWQIVALAGVLLVLWAFYQVSLHGQDFSRYIG